MLWKYFYIIQQKTFAFFLDICYHELVRGCGEMADAADSKSADGDIVRVRLPPSAWPILALNVWFNDVRSFFNVSPNARWDRGLVHVPVLGHVPDPCPNHKKTRACEKTRVFSFLLLLIVIIIAILHKKGYSSPYPIRMILWNLMRQLQLFSVCCDIYKDCVR